jgi:hypothetical protein
MDCSEPLWELKLKRPAHQLFLRLIVYVYPKLAFHNILHFKMEVIIYQVLGGKYKKKKGDQILAYRKCCTPH